MTRSEALIPEIFEVDLEETDTQYAICLPIGTKAFEICATVEVRWAFENGKVATSTAPYAVLKEGQRYASPDKMGWGGT
jgi:hypothetical protein